MKKGIVLLLLIFASLYLPAQHRRMESLLPFENYSSLVSQISSDIIHNLSNQNIYTLLDYRFTKQKNQETKQVSRIETSHILSAILLLALLLSGSLIDFLIKSRQKERKAKMQILAQVEQLQAQVEELRISNKSKDRMLSIVAHDLRSPLATLKNILDLRKSRDLSKDEFDEIIPLMIKEVNGSLELTEEILYWAKSQMEDSSSSPTKVDINQILEEQVNQFCISAKSKGVTLKVKRTCGECTALADVNMIKTIIRNLLGNAIKFCRSNDCITLSAQKNGKATLIKVADTGIGISPNNLSKLFGSSTITTKGTANENGSGLGLTLCKDFVEKNHGKIWAESEVGKGSTFYFTLP
ncbi:HAMP domain-containing sensor histidine kinase [uncultured Acetobacteroides sp.]|uniref:sensor histidine kinase n=1 Tax=uncultured Acetobacteroides sp. TaxID=1760811 RepID=UPI0029F58314|nr:HAMP domain-containing sensor histidine kinase [uncultured Acetobacteroides sp.]